jgi:hypothetical protein
MRSTSTKVEDTTLESVDKDITSTVIHLKKLLRARNWLCSSLLRPPTEVIVRILSYSMRFFEHFLVWGQIISTCHHIRNIMCASPGLWQKVYFGLDRLPQLVFERSQGNLEVVVLDFLAGRPVQRTYTKCLEVLQGQRRASWPQPSQTLLRRAFITTFRSVLESLRIFFSPSWKEGAGFTLSDPVPLQEPSADLHLRILDLRNAILPWSSSIFAGLTELHLDFRECDRIVEISEEYMVGVFEASPGVESLSLCQLHPKLDPERQYTPARTVTFARLYFSRSVELERV